MSYHSFSILLFIVFGNKILLQQYERPYTIRGRHISLERYYLNR